MVQTMMTMQRKTQKSIEILTIKDVEQSIQTLSNDDTINVYDWVDKMERRNGDSL